MRSRIIGINMNYELNYFFFWFQLKECELRVLIMYDNACMQNLSEYAQDSSVLCVCVMEVWMGV